MALDIQVPVSLDYSKADFTGHFTPATIYLEYGTATNDFTAGTATQAISDANRYEIWVSGVQDTYWFRWRVGDGTDFTEYSQPYQVPHAYAKMQEVVRGMDFPDTSREDELDQLLLSATEFISNRVCGGRSFFRDPVGSGETTYTFDIIYPNQKHLSLARGRNLDIVSVSSIKIGDYTGATKSTIASGATGWWYDPDVQPLNYHPYTDIELSDQGTAYTTFPVGRTVEITGVFGWQYIPESVRRATIDLVRFWWNSRASDGLPVGVSAFGSPVFGSGLPKSVRDLAQSAYAWKQWTA